MAGTLPAPDKNRDSGHHHHQCNHRGDSNPNLPFLKDGPYVDIILNVEGKKLYINRSVLGSASPYFKKLFGSDKAGSSKQGVPEIKILDKSYQDFVDLLTYLHPATPKELTERSAVTLLPLAREYQMANVKDSCEKFIINSLTGSSPKSTKEAKGAAVYRKRKGNGSDYLLKCLEVACISESKPVLDVCIHLYSTTDVPLKDLKASPHVSDNVRSIIYERRMNMATQHMSQMSVELNRERYEKNVLEQHLERHGRGKPVFYDQDLTATPRSPEMSRKSLKQRPMWKV